MLFKTITFFCYYLVWIINSNFMKPFIFKFLNGDLIYKYSELYFANKLTLIFRYISYSLFIILIFKFFCYNSHHKDL